MPSDSQSAPIITRVAPSPTGDPHVGTAYVALFDFLAARTSGGRFIVRIEDTDRARYDPASERQILEALRWLGLTHDEGPDVGGPHGPYRQSERTGIYRDHVEALLEAGKAYRCFCTPERLEGLRQSQRARKLPPGYDGLCRGLGPTEVDDRLSRREDFVVRLKVPKERTVEFVDQLRGRIRIEGRTIDDQVLLKSDGYPTYHLANVVDDHLMEVNEVIRAEEWIVSTPKHVLLYEAWGWEEPRWRHMPLLRNADRSKISKRKNPTSLLWYRDEGYLAEALLNFLALMGYSMPGGIEVFSLAELLAAYDPARISTSGPVFDLEKLSWLNGEHIRRQTQESLAQRIVEHYARRHAQGHGARPGGEADFRTWMEREGGFEAPGVRAAVTATIPLVQERLKTLSDYAPLCRCLFVEDLGEIAAEDLVPPKRSREEALRALSMAREVLTGIESWTASTIEGALREAVARLSWNARDLFQPIRVAATGSKVSPPLFETLALLGRERTLARLAGIS